MQTYKKSEAVRGCKPDKMVKPYEDAKTLHVSVKGYQDAGPQGGGVELQAAVLLLEELVLLQQLAYLAPAHCRLVLHLPRRCRIPAPPLPSR